MGNCVVLSKLICDIKNKPSSYHHKFCITILPNPAQRPDPPRQDLVCVSALSDCTVRTPVALVALAIPKRADPVPGATITVRCRRNENLLQS